jgi:hypothetical protein
MLTDQSRRLEIYLNGIQFTVRKRNKSIHRHPTNLRFEKENFFNNVAEKYISNGLEMLGKANVCLSKLSGFGIPKWLRKLCNTAAKRNGTFFRLL